MKNRKNILAFFFISIVGAIALDTYQINAIPPRHIQKLSEEKKQADDEKKEDEISQEEKIKNAVKITFCIGAIVGFSAGAIYFYASKHSDSSSSKSDSSVESTSSFASSDASLSKSDASLTSSDSSFTHKPVSIDSPRFAQNSSFAERRSFGNSPFSQGAQEEASSSLENLKKILSGESDYKAEVIRPEDLTTTFDSIIGLDSVKRQIQRFLRYTKEPEDFIQIGLKPVAGVILHGVPGTGKTDLARAAAKEAGLPFLYLSGSDIHAKYQGEGVARIKALMKQIEEVGSCVVFIDEIDGLAGKVNDGGITSVSDAGILNALKVAIDGFNGRKKPVFFIGATNEIKQIDPAIIRPGRLHPILVPVPTTEDQVRILRSKLYGKEIRAEYGIDVDSMVAKFGSHWTGAQITAVVNEAAWRALESGKKAVNQSSLQSAIDYFLEEEKVGSSQNSRAFRLG